MQPLVLWLALVLSSGAQAAETAKPCAVPEGLPGIHAQVASTLNAIRLRNGRGPVTQFSTLNRIATAYACELAKTGHFDHVGPDGSTLQQRAGEGGYAFCVIAENLARGQRSTTEVFKGWVLSEGHRKNMLIRGADQFGLGVVATENKLGDSRTNLTNLAENLNDDALHLRGSGANLNPRFVWVLLLGSRCT